MATTKEYYSREFPEWFDDLPEVSEDGVNLRELYKDLVNDVKNILPTKTYVGNCSKEFVKRLLDLYGQKEFERIQPIDFPPSREHPITTEQCMKEMNTLFKKDMVKKGVSVIVKKFHPSLDRANRKSCKSPYDGWNQIKSDYNKFLAFYENRLRCSDWFKEKDNVKYLIQGRVPDFIYGIGLSTSRKYPQVSYFKPHLAKYIVEKYLADYDTVFDPFAGYCGRMLGVLASGKNYYGQDLCDSTVEENVNVYQDLYIPFCTENKIEINNVCFDLTDSTEQTSEHFDCLFTCPPYSDIEQWPGVDPVKRSCDEWIDMCLKNYKCARYVFVVDDTIEKYKDNIVETLENTSHFGRNNEYLVVIDRHE